MPVREQLVTQIVLGILCDELPAGHRLPSTRELARRFKVHANTISAAYKQLEQERWVEFRHGSGVFVRGSKPSEELKGSLALDRLLADLFRSARELGVPLSEVRSRLQHWIAIQPPDHFLLLEPEEELRRIAAEEMRRAVRLPVQEADLDAGKSAGNLAGAIPVCLPRWEIQHPLRISATLPSPSRHLSIEWQMPSAATTSPIRSSELRRPNQRPQS